jgi:hypothetical protein
MIHQEIENPLTGVAHFTAITRQSPWRKSPSRITAKERLSRHHFRQGQPERTERNALWRTARNAWNRWTSGFEWTDSPRRANIPGEDILRGCRTTVVPEAWVTQSVAPRAPCRRENALDAPHKGK